MMSLPTRSPITIDVQPNGGVSVYGPDGGHAASVDVVQESGPVRDWMKELCLPKDWGALDVLARPDGFSSRMIQFVLIDQSPTRYPGGWCFEPQRWTYDPYGQLLTLGHLGLVIGACEHIRAGHRDEAPHAQGHFLIGQARLYNSKLARAAWLGILDGIFPYVSAIVARPADEPPGGGRMLEVGITDDPGCLGARVLKTWEEPS